MKCKELTAALDILKRVLADPRVGRDHRERLKKGLRELEKARRSGPGRLRAEQIFHATAIIAEVLHDVTVAQANDQAHEPQESVR